MFECFDKTQPRLQRIEYSTERYSNTITVMILLFIFFKVGDLVTRKYKYA